ncbi:hypothetical protein LVX13_07385 [Streptomyces albulus]|uniref:hypothetical protein n=1 Tax=Streptomyces noursei TaxID=1971 RepID=UPI001F42F70B|nr:hypothetical protein [Streptomyces noursei]MCE4942951.1 hypothetical protein [Streptomyces noursei]
MLDFLMARHLSSSLVIRTVAGSGLDNVGAKYFVSPDQEDGGSWSFTADQIAQTTIELWPGSSATGPFPPHGAVELNAAVGDAHCVLTFYSEGQALVFADQDPLTTPARIILSLLNVLAPDTPTVWYTDADATPMDLDLTVDAAQLAEELGS